jgi:hypothetical protein
MTAPTTVPERLIELDPPPGLRLLSWVYKGDAFSADNIRQLDGDPDGLYEAGYIEHAGSGYRLSAAAWERLSK